LKAQKGIVQNTQKSTPFEKACFEVSEYLLSLTDEEFEAELEKNKDGFIAQMLREEEKRWEEYHGKRNNQTP